MTFALSVLLPLGADDLPHELTLLKPPIPLGLVLTLGGKLGTCLNNLRPSTFDLRPPTSDD